MITNEDKLVRGILCNASIDIRPLTYALRELEELVFVKGIEIDDISIGKDIYGAAAKKLNKTRKTTTRQIEILANKCWDNMIRDNTKMKYIGRELDDVFGPREIVVYLAYYAYYEKPYYMLHQL